MSAQPAARPQPTPDPDSAALDALAEALVAAALEVLDTPQIGAVPPRRKAARG